MTAMTRGRLRVMYEGWLLGVQFQWAPIITFSRRRLQLLDWFEKNLEPVSFIDDPERERVGVGLVVPDLRVAVTRSGMLIESGASGIEIEKLLPAIKGVFEVMEPRSVIATRFFAMGATPLADVDYATECAAFGRLVGGAVAVPGDALTVADGSAVVDLESETLKVQVEWGVVNGRELSERLITPRMSRIAEHANSEDDDTSALVRWASRRRAFPEVAIFTDQVGRWQTAARVSDVDSVLKLVSEAKQTASTIAASFADTFENVAKEAG
jgi:hypothetical protein